MQPGGANRRSPGKRGTSKGARARHGGRHEFLRAGRNLCYDSSPVIDADGSLLGRDPDDPYHGVRLLSRTGLLHPGRFRRPGICDPGGPDRHCDLLRPPFPGIHAGAGDRGCRPGGGSSGRRRGRMARGLYEAEMRVAAFQNGYFVALCNRVGREDCLEFAGESFVVGPDGAVVARAPAGRESILIADLDLAEVGRAPMHDGSFFSTADPSCTAPGSAQTGGTLTMPATRERRWPGSWASNRAPGSRRSTLRPIIVTLLNRFPTGARFPPASRGPVDLCHLFARSRERAGSRGSRSAGSRFERMG